MNSKGQKKVVKTPKKPKMEKEEVEVDQPVQKVKQIKQINQVKQPVQSTKVDKPAQTGKQYSKESKHSKFAGKPEKVQKDKPIKQAKSNDVEKVEQHAEKVGQHEEVENIELVDETGQYKFEKQLISIRLEMEEVRNKLRLLSNSFKGLESAYNYDVKKVAKSTRKRTKGKKTGFAKPKLVPDALAELIEVEQGTELTGPEVTRKVWDQLAKRGLISKDDGKLFRTDKTVSKVFNVPTSVNKINDSKDKVNGFNFYNLQKYVKNAYPPKVEVENA
jgi:hypothetical protein